MFVCQVWAKTSGRGVLPVKPTKKELSVPSTEKRTDCVGRETRKAAMLTIAVRTRNQRMCHRENTVFATQEQKKNKAQRPKTRASLDTLTPGHFRERKTATEQKRSTFNKAKKESKKQVPGGTRTRNPQIRSLIRYPLRHEDHHEDLIQQQLMSSNKQKKYSPVNGESPRQTVFGSTLLALILWGECTDCKMSAGGKAPEKARSKLNLPKNPRKEASGHPLPSLRRVEGSFREKEHETSTPPESNQDREKSAHPESNQGPRDIR